MKPQFQRRSLRLPDYDYSETGAYFVTICTQFQRCLWGEIIGEKAASNNAGQMVEKWWKELKHKFPAIEMDEYILMPNHLHGIVVIEEHPNAKTSIWAPLRGRPGKGHPHRGAPTLGDMVDWFKTMTTNEYIRGVSKFGWKPFPGKLWQRNYYERVIRDEKELEKIREYIQANPVKWAFDRENPNPLSGPSDQRGEIEILLGGLP